MIRENSKPFPKDFLWGAATSAHQVEGGNVNNDWAAAECSDARLRTPDSGIRRPRCVPPAGLACDSYNRYEEDFDLAVSLGHNAHRLSLEWSRLEPREGQFDMKEVAHYRQVLQALRDRGLKSFVTLWHFTLPSWASGDLHRFDTDPHGYPRKSVQKIRENPYRGWEDPRIVYYFVKYTEFCAKNFGDLVDFWITENEPTQVYGLAGYLIGNWPPFKKRAVWSYLKVCWNLGQAHNKAYDAIKKVLPSAQVGLVENFSWTEGGIFTNDSEYSRTPTPDNSWSLARIRVNPVDRLLAFLINYFNQRVSLVLVKSHLDFLGVNHYFHNHVHFSWRHGLTMDEGHGGLWASDLGWTLEPRVIYDVLKSVKIRIKSVQIPIYITENGLADAADISRQKFTEETLQWVKKAMDEGVDVRGYLHWSLLDNYEWLEGYRAKFGLVAVDFAHGQARTIRPSAIYLRDFINQKTGNS